MHQLAARLADADGATRSKAAFDRTLSCQLRDLGAAFGGRLNGGHLVDIRQVSTAEARAAQIKLTMSSDDLLALVAGDLHVGSAWASGRMRVDAGIRDLLRLRTIF